MMNFREELKKINEKDVKEINLEEQTEIFLTGLLNALSLRKMNSFKKLVFVLSSEKMCVKLSNKHVTNLFEWLCYMHSKELYQSIKNRFESEGIRIEEYGEEPIMFTAYFD